MIGIQNNKDRNFDDFFPGCMDRMVKPFNVNTGSSFSRNRSDVVGVSKPIGGIMDDKPVICEVRRTSSNKSLNTTPMKMLIAQEMLKDAKTKHNSPSVVAKLMGLDAVPQQQSDSIAQRIHSRSYSCDSLPQAGRRMECCQHGNEFLEKQMQCEVHQSSEQTRYKDVYEVWQQSRRQNCIQDISEEKERYNNEHNEKKMALVQQHFIEAKRLATDETLRKTKEFQDALEVLSSNKDLFLKFLQEPNSLFSQQSYKFDLSPSPETKRITLLRPSKMVEDKSVYRSQKMDEIQIKKPSRVWKENERHQNIHGLSPSPTTADRRSNAVHTQRTRIVVLKPSPGKNQDLLSVSPRTVHGEDFFEEPEDDEPYDAREIAKEITRQIRENLSSCHRDETLFSSVCSNGYIGDESSSHKSENEFAVDDFSDCEVISPTSWHSWDDTNRFGTPASSSSFSPASCSRESRVCREAKKRLSQRWARMALNENCQEKMHVCRSSNTLGEMLAFSGTTKLVNPEEDNLNKDQELRESTIGLTVGDESPRTLLRSKSLPVTSTLNGARLNLGLDSKDQIKDKDTKTSLKGKLSSLFFSKSKKSSNTQSKAESQATPSAAETCSPFMRAFSGDSAATGSKQGCFSYKEGLSVTKHAISANLFENQDEPSPISVLEPSFEEDGTPYLTCFGTVKPDRQGSRNTDHPIKPNLIDKSPPIGSISRTFSLEDSRSETVHPFLSKPLASSEPNHEQDWFLLIQTLLSMAGLHGETRFESCLGRYHSAESPLDPLLRQKYINLDDKEFLPEDKRRQLRSSRKLVFDCVNEALVNITSYNSKPFSSEDCALPLLVNQVWSLIKEWFFEEAFCDSNDYGEVRKEVAGKKWNDHIKLERGFLEKEIEKRLIEELVEEAVVGFSGRV